VIGTNDVDCRARGLSAEEEQFLAALVAGRALGESVTYADLETARQVVLVGLEPEDECPIVFLRLRKAVRKKRLAVVTVAPYRSRGSEKLSASLVPTVPGDEAAAVAPFGRRRRHRHPRGERLAASPEPQRRRCAGRPRAPSRLDPASRGRGRASTRLSFAPVAVRSPRPRPRRCGRHLGRRVLRRRRAATRWPGRSTVTAPSSPGSSGDLDDPAALAALEQVGFWSARAAPSRSRSGPTGLPGRSARGPDHVHDWEHASSRGPRQPAGAQRDDRHPHSRRAAARWAATWASVPRGARPSSPARRLGCGRGRG
jgi:hypothetical protein